MCILYWVQPDCYKSELIFFFWIGSSASISSKFKDTEHKNVFWMLSSKSANFFSIVLSFIGTTMD